MSEEDDSSHNGPKSKDCPGPKGHLVLTYIFFHGKQRAVALAVFRLPAMCSLIYCYVAAMKFFPLVQKIFTSEREIHNSDKLYFLFLEPL
jgi:hypothetical protein